LTPARAARTSFFALVLLPVVVGMRLWAFLARSVGKKRTSGRTSFTRVSGVIQHGSWQLAMLELAKTGLIIELKVGWAFADFRGFVQDHLVASTVPFAFACLVVELEFPRTFALVAYDHHVLIRTIDHDALARLVLLI
jgi:hypothetical protein